MKKRTLSKDTVDFSAHYRMYKAGKTWLFAAIFTVSLGLGTSVEMLAQADTGNAPAQTAKTDSTQADKQVPLKGSAVSGNASSGAGDVQTVNPVSGTKPIDKHSLTKNENGTIATSDQLSIAQNNPSNPNIQSTSANSNLELATEAPSDSQTTSQDTNDPLPVIDHWGNIQNVGPDPKNDLWISPVSNAVNGESGGYVATRNKNFDLGSAPRHLPADPMDLLVAAMNPGGTPLHRSQFQFTEERPYNPDEPGLYRINITMFAPGYSGIPETDPVTGKIIGDPTAGVLQQTSIAYWINYPKGAKLDLDLQVPDVTTYVGMNKKEYFNQEDVNAQIKINGDTHLAATIEEKVDASNVNFDVPGDYLATYTVLNSISDQESEILGSKTFTVHVLPNKADIQTRDITVLIGTQLVGSVIQNAVVSATGGDGKPIKVGDNSAPFYVRWVTPRNGSYDQDVNMSEAATFGTTQLNFGNGDIATLNGYLGVAASRKDLPTEYLTAMPVRVTVLNYAKLDVPSSFKSSIAGLEKQAGGSGTLLKQDLSKHLFLSAHMPNGGVAANFNPNFTSDQIYTPAAAGKDSTIIVDWAGLDFDHPKAGTW